MTFLQEIRRELISMPKRKSGAQTYVADGAGGMRPVTDLRFEDGAWAIDLVVPARDAETWMAYLDAEIEDRGWNSSGFSQLDAEENSGTLSVHAQIGPSPPTLDIVWEKTRGGDLHLRARPSGTPGLSLDVAEEFIEAIAKRQLEGKTIRAHRRDLLAYEGLPWRGELWLDDDHRLGPPSMFPDTLIGPQVVIVDAMVEGIGQQGITANFEKRVQEVRVFLGFVLGLTAKPVRWEYGWVPDIDDERHIADCKLRSIGYAELSVTQGFPSAGSAPPIERRDITRPGLGPLGIWPDMDQEWVPGDIEALWATFVRLPGAKRDQLLRAGNSYLIARSMWPDQRTAYAGFLVVACEALKPIGKKHDRKNIYDVVRSFLGEGEAELLRRLPIPPQLTRHRLFHRGELAAGELLPMLIHDYFSDPSFHEMIGELSRITRECLIEWLRREGDGRHTSA